MMNIKIKIRKCGICGKVRPSLKLNDVDFYACDECINKMKGIDGYLELVEKFKPMIVQ